VRITVSNLVGQRVAILLDQPLEAGYHHINWNGQAQSGQAAASGIYLYSIEAGDFVQKRKMVLVR
jgi:flagellar hook assembly protein FlgD